MNQQKKPQDSKRKPKTSKTSMTAGQKGQEGKKGQKEVHAKKPIRYADAGVHIGKANHFVRFLTDKTRAWDRKEKGVIGGIGGFAALRDISDKLKGIKKPVLVMATDGVGTKLELAKTTAHHEAIGTDLVAMCVNDLICSGATPLFFLDYYATGKLNLPRARAFAEGLLRGCKQSGCALVGGETAEMPGFYPDNKYDVAGFCVGIADGKNLIRPRGKKGSVLIGLPSSGVHANGFSLVRRLIKENRLTLSARVKGNDGNLTTVNKALMEPTRIYVSAVKAIADQFNLLGIAHITGGGITENLARILPDGIGADIKRDVLMQLPAAPLFEMLQEASGLSDAEMLKTFNCGIGMILVVPATKENSVLQALTDLGEMPLSIGTLSSGGRICQV